MIVSFVKMKYDKDSVLLTLSVHKFYKSLHCRRVNFTTFRRYCYQGLMSKKMSTCPYTNSSDTAGVIRECEKFYYQVKYTQKHIRLAARLNLFNKFPLRNFHDNKTN